MSAKKGMRVSIFDACRTSSGSGMQPEGVLALTSPEHSHPQTPHFVKRVW